MLKAEYIVYKRIYKHMCYICMSK